MTTGFHPNDTLAAYDPATLRAALDSFWAVVGDDARPISSLFGQPVRPLAQFTAQQPAADQNPYFDLALAFPAALEHGRTVLDLPHSCTSERLTGLLRSAGAHPRLLRRYYTWSLPSPGDIHTVLTALGPDPKIIEIGAGGGYWASVLTHQGADVLAFDIRPPVNPQVNLYAAKAWHTVYPGGPDKTFQHPDRALMLCWPPLNDPMAAKALEHYRGRTLILIGDERYCADELFWKTVRTEWTVTAESAHHIPYQGNTEHLTDRVLVLARARS